MLPACAAGVRRGQEAWWVRKSEAGRRERHAQAGEWGRVGEAVAGWDAGVVSRTLAWWGTPLAFSRAT